MKVKSLNDESEVKFLITWWGNGIALGFKGELKAIERCYNWASNTGVTRGILHWIYDIASIGYVLTNQNDLMKGLIAQFRAEIIMSKEIPLLEDRIEEETQEIIIEYNEPLIHKMAVEKANEFMKSKIVVENFMNNSSTPEGPVYSIGHLEGPLDETKE
jgi:hypothetical protein